MFKQSFELTKVDYLNFVLFAESLENDRKGVNIISRLKSKFNKAKQIKKFEEYVDQNIKSHSLGQREFSVENEILKYSDLKIERVLVPNEINHIYSTKDYIYIVLKTEQSFIVKKNKNTVIDRLLEENGFIISKK